MARSKRPLLHQTRLLGRVVGVWAAAADSGLGNRWPKGYGDGLQAQPTGSHNTYRLRDNCSPQGALSVSHRLHQCVL